MSSFAELFQKINGFSWLAFAGLLLIIVTFFPGMEQYAFFGYLTFFYAVVSSVVYNGLEKFVLVRNALLGIGLLAYMFIFLSSLSVGFAGMTI